MKDILMRIVARLFLLSALALSSLTHLKLSYQLRSPLPFPIEKPGTLDTNLNKSVLTRYHFSYLSHLSTLAILVTLIFLVVYFLHPHLPLPKTPQ